MPEVLPTAASHASEASTQVLPRQRGADTITEPGDSGHGRIDLLVWALPALVAAALGGWRLTQPALWADELATWGAVRISWDQLWQLSGAVDLVLTPYYALMKIWTSVAGTSTTALRLPAVIAIVATTVLVTALARRLAGRWSGLVGGLLFAFVPATTRYAQEARPYALAMFTTALALLLLLRLLDNPAPLRALGYCGAILLAALVHPLSAILVLVGHLFAIAFRQIRAGRPAWYGSIAWVAASAPGGIVALVLLYLGSRTRTQISWIHPLTLTTFGAIPDRLFLSGAVGGIVLGLAVIATRRTSEHVAVAAAGFGPLLALLLADQITPLWVARYVLVTIAPLAVLAASAMIRFGTPQAGVAMALAAVLGWPAQLTDRDPAGHSEDSTKVETVIGPRYKAGDVAVFPDTNPSIPWAPRDMYARYLASPRPPDVLALKPQRTDGQFLATECPDASCLGNPPRVWIVRVDNPTDPFTDMSPGKAAVLRARYRVVQRWSYPLVGIVLLVRK